MNHPSQLLSRARRQRNHALPPRQDFPAPAPAAPTGTAPAVPPPAAVPAPTPQQPQAVAPPPVAPAPPVEPAAPGRPRPAGHALYSQIMRSHDRMGTRHL